MALVKFGFANESSDRFARNVFLIRGCVIFIAVIAMIPPLAMLGQDPPELHWQDFSSWAVQLETESYPYVCQRQAAQKGVCDNGWRVGSTGASCYYLFADGSENSQIGAQMQCNRQRATLAIILSASDNADVHSVCADSQPCWIGLSNHFGTWIWGGDTSLTLGRTGYYNWERGEPREVSDGVGAVIGDKFLREGRASPAGTVIGVLANVCCMCMLTGCFYAGVNAKNGSCVLCVACCDSFCCCLITIMVVVVIALLGSQSSPNGVAWVIISIIQMGLLVSIAISTMLVQPKITAEQVIVHSGGVVVVGTVSGPAVGQGQVVSGPDMQVVVGRPVTCDTIPSPMASAVVVQAPSTAPPRPNVPCEM